MADILPAGIATSVVAIGTRYLNAFPGGAISLPQRIAVVGQGTDDLDYPLEKLQVTSPHQAGSTFGFGSPIHLMVKQLQGLTPNNTNIVPVTIYPLDKDPTSLPAIIDVSSSDTVTINTELVISVNNTLSKLIIIPAGGQFDPQVAADAVNSIISMPVVATVEVGALRLTTKWSGESSDGLVVIMINESEELGFQFVKEQDGFADPSVDPALLKVGDDWETLFLSNFAGVANLDRYEAFNEIRWTSGIHNPAVFFYGNTAADITEAISGTSSRTTDRTNCQLVSPASLNLAFVVAATQVAIIANQANSNPPSNYKGTVPESGARPGLSSEQWNFTERQEAVINGSSTIKVINGAITMNDTVTMYTESTDGLPPPYRQVVTIVKLQNVIFNIDNIVNSPDWLGKPIIDDDLDDITNTEARKKKDMVTELSNLADALESAAVIINAAYTQANLTVLGNELDPNRLDIFFPVILTGTVEVIGVDFTFGLINSN